METHSSVLAWRIPWTEEPGGLLSTQLHRVRHDWSDLACMHALEKEMATHSSVLAWRIPGTGDPGGLPSVGLHRVRHDWSDLAAAAAAACLPDPVLSALYSTASAKPQLNWQNLAKQMPLSSPSYPGGGWCLPGSPLVRLGSGGARIWTKAVWFQSLMLNGWCGSHAIEDLFLSLCAPNKKYMEVQGVSHLKLRWFALAMKIKSIFISLLILCPCPNEHFGHIFVHSSDVNQTKQILVYLSIQGSQLPSKCWTSLFLFVISSEEP